MEIVSKNKMIISLQELKDNGLSLYKINRLVNEGMLKKLNNKVYLNLSYRGEESEYYYVYAYVPDGVVCLLSAASFYNLTDYRTDAIDVAIRRKAKVSTVPEWPDMNIHYYTNERYELGIDVIKQGEDLFKIYNIEKTVVDIVYYRNTVGIEETKEILINYLKREDRNINQLIRYAERMKCQEVMSNYLEVLI